MYTQGTSDTCCKSNTAKTELYFLSPTSFFSGSHPISVNNVASAEFVTRCPWSFPAPNLHVQSLASFVCSPCEIVHRCLPFSTITPRGRRRLWSSLAGVLHSLLDSTPSSHHPSSAFSPQPGQGCKNASHSAAALLSEPRGLSFQTSQSSLYPAQLLLSWAAFPLSLVRAGHSSVMCCAPVMLASVP